MKTLWFPLLRAGCLTIITVIAVHEFVVWWSLSSVWPEATIGSVRWNCSAEHFYGRNIRDFPAPGIYRRFKACYNWKAGAWVIELV